MAAGGRDCRICSSQSAARVRRNEGETRQFHDHYLSLHAANKGGLVSLCATRVHAMEVYKAGDPRAGHGRKARATFLQSTHTGQEGAVCTTSSFPRSFPGNPGLFLNSNKTTNARSVVAHRSRHDDAAARERFPVVEGAPRWPPIARQMSPPVQRGRADIHFIRPDTLLPLAANTKDDIACIVWAYQDYRTKHTAWTGAPHQKKRTTKVGLGAGGRDVSFYAAVDVFCRS